MHAKLREQAVALRKQGLSYREILQQIPVAKSTLSEWLHSVNLSEYQQQRLTKKKLASAKRGGEAKRKIRLLTTGAIQNAARSEIGSLTKRELWLMGIMLYWAEGSKEKEYHPGSRVQFTNTDERMIRLFLLWLKKICHKDLLDLTLDIYIHESQRERTNEIIIFWAKNVGCGQDYFRHIYYKKGNPKTERRNTGISYHGTLKINVKSSSSLNRRIAGWTLGVIDYFR